MTSRQYRGRFAPSPTGPLHAGSLVAALASWLDAKAHQGTWLVRIEDIDPPRCPQGADTFILQQLTQCALVPDEPPIWQSQRHGYYEQALAKLCSQGLAYPCGCTRKDIEMQWNQLGILHERHVERPYPGTCRDGLHGKMARSWRFALEKYLRHLSSGSDSELPENVFHLENEKITWEDRRLGPQSQTPASVAGDFILQRADRLYAYQLAVVVDDHEQKITHIVRGEDLTDNTPRQLLLQRALGMPHPLYMHMQLVRMDNGEKLSKQHGAPAVDVRNPLQALNAAALNLQLQPVSPDSSLSDALSRWVLQWQDTYNVHRD